jgi:hypothetical protein
MQVGDMLGIADAASKDQRVRRRKTKFSARAAGALWGGGHLALPMQVPEADVLAAVLRPMLPRELIAEELASRQQRRDDDERVRASQQLHPPVFNPLRLPPGLPRQPGGLKASMSFVSGTGSVASSFCVVKSPIVSSRASASNSTSAYASPLAPGASTLSTRSAFAARLDCSQSLELYAFPQDAELEAQGGAAELEAQGGAAELEALSAPNLGGRPGNR